MRLFALLGVGMITLSACLHGTAVAVTVENRSLGIEIDDTGALRALRHGTVNLLASGQPAPILQLRVERTWHQPVGMSWDSTTGMLRLRYAPPGVPATIRITAKLTHLVCELVAVEPVDTVELALWGPYPTTIGETVGETVGVVRNQHQLSPALRGQVINDASNPGHFNWHIYTRMNWGEPWYAGFRESQTQYRLKNQNYYARNLMPRMLGWFQMNAETTLEDAEWLLARAGGESLARCDAQGRPLETLAVDPRRLQIAPGTTRIRVGARLAANDDPGLKCEFRTVGAPDRLGPPEVTPTEKAADDKMP